ncbi:manganese/zinc/iron transport system permease protein [Pseudochelatococcus lubricantis]|uniref:Manganese/zinc/iron transport system permease protein n=1 Tax=Pseudochelatococcus lubricantis TaxID=1538102 RepID=A0ABX0V203_9HYPH|nr:metal ABC transporter permease [Pseudochelatococcus lubricantis]NIJ58245.1 manganese/zinc/iron transport system permease protein [Pseudochelatococcus lubricantis]
MLDAFVAALFLQAGYNTALVTAGAAVLGASAGAIGAFMLLRKRSLVSDAISHATLPGLALAFIVMALATGDGRFMPGLLAGAALSAGLGLVAVEWITRRTRLTEDVAIGAVLSVFFGLGIVLLTVIQAMDTGRQAGISGFLLGSTAGMLRSEAEVIAVAATLTGLAIFVLRRPLTLVCFDQEYAATQGVNVRATDLATMALVLAVTVIGLKVAGLVLIVALTILPPVAARFWTNRVERMVLIAAAIGAVAAYLGAVVSSLGPGLPTGALIVLVSFAIFLFSLVFSPLRGLLAGQMTTLALRKRVHERQGLLALARDEPIYDPLTLKVLRRAGYIRADGAATLEGRSAALAATREEALWGLYRKLFPDQALNADYHGLTPINEALPPDVVRDLEQRCNLRAA